jgi:hypothetical protein
MRNGPLKLFTMILFTMQKMEDWNDPRNQEDPDPGSRDDVHWVQAYRRLAVCCVKQRLGVPRLLNGLKSKPGQ